MTHESLLPITSNDHLTKSQLVDIGCFLKYGSETPLDPEYTSNGISIDAEPVDSDSQVQIALIGAKHFAIAPVDLDRSLVFPSNKKVEEKSKKLPFLVRRPTSATCANDGSRQNTLFSLNPSQDKLPCESCGGNQALNKPTIEQVEQRQLELGELKELKATFTGQADTILSGLVEQLGTQNAEQISGLLKSLGINANEIMVKQALPLIKSAIEFKGFNIADLLLGNAELPEELRGIFPLIKTLLGDKVDEIQNQLELAENVVFGYGDQEVDIYELPDGVENMLFLTHSIPTATKEISPVQEPVLEKDTNASTIFSSLLTGETVETEPFNVHNVIRSITPISVCNYGRLFYDEVAHETGLIYDMPNTGYSLLYKPATTKATLVLINKITDIPEWVEQPGANDLVFNPKSVITSTDQLGFNPNVPVPSSLVEQLNQSFYEEITWANNNPETTSDWQKLIIKDIDRKVELFKKSQIEY